MSIERRKENLSQETIEKMSISNLLNRQFEYAKEIMKFKMLNNSGVVYEEGFMPINDSDFILPH